MRVDVEQFERQMRRGFPEFVPGDWDSRLLRWATPVPIPSICDDGGARRRRSSRDSGPRHFGFEAALLDALDGSSPSSSGRLGTGRSKRDLDKGLYQTSVGLRLENVRGAQTSDSRSSSFVPRNGWNFDRGYPSNRSSRLGGTNLCISFNLDDLPVAIDVFEVDSPFLVRIISRIRCKNGPARRFSGLDSRFRDCSNDEASVFLLRSISAPVPPGRTNRPYFALTRELNRQMELSEWVFHSISTLLKPEWLTVRPVNSSGMSSIRTPVDSHKGERRGVSPHANDERLTPHCRIQVLRRIPSLVILDRKNADVGQTGGTPDGAFNYPA